eukprot:CAMPEP_0196748574 /NCGR_PEP_ID=MMETSP1091-20130531/73874_1 /TAXON_ID=302021 /ORGANISM="Rhodomonas sp., Strain CCMP768" /LENGTH=40 /DNA_ID= /DNA_START= /DNA_END= /DNA_ORIENTATION=
MRMLCRLKAHFLGVSNRALEDLKAAHPEPEGGFGYLDAQA